MCGGKREREKIEIKQWEGVIEWIEKDSGIEIEWEADKSNLRNNQPTKLIYMCVECQY